MKDLFNFLLGAVVGAFFALMFAPQTGEDLRANLKTTAEKDWQQLQEQWQAELEKISHRLDQLQMEPVPVPVPDEAEEGAPGADPE